MLGQSLDLNLLLLRTPRAWVSVSERSFGGSICTAATDHTTLFPFSGETKPGSSWITKVDILMTKSYKKILLTFLLIREISINTIRRYHYTPSSMAVT